MAENTDNHTIELLQKIRSEIRDGFKKVDERFQQVDERFDAMDERFDGVDLRINGVTHMLTLLAGNAHDHETRLEKLESK